MKKRNTKSNNRSLWANRELDFLSTDDLSDIIKYGEKLAKLYFGENAKKFYRINPFNIKPDNISLRRSQSILSDTKTIMIHAISQGLQDIRAITVIHDVLTQYIPDRSYFATTIEQDYAEIDAICHILKQHFRYTKDPIHREFIREASSALFFGNLDCDDLVVLGAIMLGILGHHFQIILAGSNGIYVHVYLLAKLKDNTKEQVYDVALDPTNKRENAGWFPRFEKYSVLIDSRIDLGMKNNNILKKHNFTL